MCSNKQGLSNNNRLATGVHQELYSMSEMLFEKFSATYLKGVVGTALSSAFGFFLDTVTGEISNK